MKPQLLILAVGVLAGCQQVTITTTPCGAGVYIDSTYRGSTPLQVALSTDRAYSVELRMAGYHPYIASISRLRRKPMVDPSISNMSLAMSYLDMVANGHPAGLLLSLCGRIAMAKYNYDLSPRHIHTELVPS
jgi:hypothetical protein